MRNADFKRTHKGTLLSQHLLGPVSEHAILRSILLLEAIAALGVQMMGIGSAAIFFLSALPLLFVLLINDLVMGKGRKEIMLLTYGLGQFFPLLGGMMLLVPVVEVFVPLVRPVLSASSVRGVLNFFVDRTYRRRCACG